MINSMDSVAYNDGRKIVPFWNRIPAFFLYALNPNPLLFAIGLGISAYLISTWWAYLIFYAITVKYSIASLQHTLQGELKPPKMTSEVLVDSYELPLMLFVILVLYFSMLGSISNSLGYAVALAVYALGIFLFPAVIICLGLSEDILFSINPINLLGLVKAIGWPYLALYGLLFFLGSAQSTFESLFLSNANAELLPAMWLGINTIFSVISFHMMGYVAMQYHEVLGEPEPRALSNGLSVTDCAESDLLEKFISEGNAAAAAAEFRTLILSHPDNLELRRRLHNYALANNQIDIMKRNAINLMPLAVRNSKEFMAAQVFSDCREREQLCHPKDSLCYLPILHELRKQHRFQDAVIFAKGFHKNFPDNEQTPYIYLELAKIFTEELHRDDLAKKLLNFTLKGFGKHPLNLEIEQYLGMINQLSKNERAL